MKFFGGTGNQRNAHNYFLYIADNESFNSDSNTLETTVKKFLKSRSFDVKSLNIENLYLQYR